MSATLDIDPDFNHQFELRAIRSSKSLSVVTNQVMRGIAIKALLKTKKADRGSIESLGLSRSQVMGKRGRLLKRTQLVANREAMALFAGFMHKILHKNPRSMTAQEFSAAAIAHFRNRLRGVGFTAYGWQAAVRKLSNALAMSFPTLGVAGASKGNARVAHDGWNPVAEIYNEVPTMKSVRTPASVERVTKNLVAAVQDAVREETRDMASHVSKAIEQTWNNS